MVFSSFLRHSADNVPQRNNVLYNTRYVPLTWNQGHFPTNIRSQPQYTADDRPLPSA